MPTQVVVAPPARAAMFVTLTVPPGSERAVRAVLAGVSDLSKSVSFRNPAAGLLVVIGIGSALWDRMIAGVPKPRDLHVFPGAVGATHVAPSTPGDLLVHLRAEHMDQCFEFARLLAQQLGAHATVVDEVHGFKYFDNRDLLGFVDGTANPQDAEAFEAAHVSAERDAAHEGASYVIVQKYVHDMAAWEALPVEEQERVIGRYKLNDVEIPDGAKATDSHVFLTTITDEQGVEHDILRDNMPFGALGDDEYGTYFIGYAGNPLVTEQMITNMFVGKPEGRHDRILDFSTARTGALFYVPTAAFLDGIDDLDLPGAAAAQDDPGDEPAVAGHMTDADLLGPPDRSGADLEVTPNAAIGLDASGGDAPVPGGAPDPEPDDTADTADTDDTDDTVAGSIRLGSLRAPRKDPS